MNRLLFFLTLIVFSFSACEEIPPLVTGSTPGNTGPTPPSDQLRQVVIEEFTGVACVQCPSGSAIIKDLVAIHGQQLIAISIHSSENFSVPTPHNQYDFRTVEGDALNNYLGGPLGFPSAVVNRKLFDGRSSLQLGKNEWPGFVAEEKATPPKVKLSIEPTFNAANREASIEVTIFVEETITDPNVNLSLIFTEDDIVDYQVTPSGPVDDYKHEHVFRGMATPYDGQPLTESLTIGGQITKSFNYTIPAEWKENKVNVIAMVSLAGTRKDVLQAHKVHLIE